MGAPTYVVVAGRLCWAVSMRFPNNGVTSKKTFSSHNLHYDSAGAFHEQLRDKHTRWTRAHQYNRGPSYEDPVWYDKREEEAISPVCVLQLERTFGLYRPTNTYIKCDSLDSRGLHFLGVGAHKQNADRKL